MELIDQCKILLDDLEPQNVMVLFGVLNSDNYRLVVAFNGKSAVKQALMQQPDIIIMDWDMSGINRNKSQHNKLES